MFTRTEALDFAFERGLKGANFVCLSNGKMVVYYWEGNGTDLTYGSGPDDLKGEMSEMSEMLRGRADGWFVSAKSNGSWYWYFDSSGDRVPHNG